MHQMFRDACKWSMRQQPSKQPSKHKSICITFVQRRPNVFDVGPTLYRCYINVLYLLGGDDLSRKAAIIGVSLTCDRWTARMCVTVKDKNVDVLTNRGVKRMNKRVVGGGASGHIQAKLGQENLPRMVIWIRWHCRRDTEFEINSNPG